MYNILNDIHIDAGESKRMNCPFCKGYNTFTITNELGNIKWNCYKASCNAKGNRRIGLTAQDIRNMNKVAAKEKTFVLPDCIVPHGNRVDLMRFADSYDLTLQDIGAMYDVKENRIVFPIVHGGKIVDATGRALTKRQPKWKRYGSSSLPYTFGQGTVAVVVEDCVSAAVVGSVNNLVGVALLGTSLLEEHKQYLAQFSTVVVALDPDALVKTMEYAKDLRSVAKTVKVLRLEDDIKYRNVCDMKKLGDINGTRTN